jgi:hypothetical protein
MDDRHAPLITGKIHLGSRSKPQSALLRFRGTSRHRNPAILRVVTRRRVPMPEAGEYPRRRRRSSGRHALAGVSARSKSPPDRPAASARLRSSRLPPGLANSHANDFDHAGRPRAQTRTITRRPTHDFDQPKQPRAQPSPLPGAPKALRHARHPAHQERHGRHHGTHAKRHAHQAPRPAPRTHSTPSTTTHTPNGTQCVRHGPHTRH